MRVLLYLGGFSCIRGGLGFYCIWVFDGVCWGLLLYFGSLVGFGSCGFVVPVGFFGFFMWAN